MNQPSITPKLDPIDLCMSLGPRTERLHEHEFLLLEQLIAYREQALTGESLKDVIGLEHTAPDRIVRAVMTRLIRKTNALHPPFPLVRKLTANTWIYTEIRPKIRRRVGPKAGPGAGRTKVS